MQIYLSLPRNQANKQKKMIMPNTANLANVICFICKYPIRHKTGNPMYANVYRGRPEQNKHNVFSYEPP